MRSFRLTQISVSACARFARSLRLLSGGCPITSGAAGMPMALSLPGRVSQGMPSSFSRCRTWQVRGQRHAEVGKGSCARLPL